MLHFISFLYRGSDFHAKILNTTPSHNIYGSGSGQVDWFGVRPLLNKQKWRYFCEASIFLLFFILFGFVFFSFSMVIKIWRAIRLFEVRPSSSANQRCTNHNECTFLKKDVSASRDL